MFDRYLDRSEATEKSFTTDGWFLTGDYVTRDEEGAYKIMGRLSQDIIKKSGYKLSALEIEGRLLQHKSVQEACVLGVPNDKYGEEVAAFIVPK
mmetsp:Transcript_19309/g.13868  ORF Transcript_19309/g.13868 Transcript_19309/m.13868 type:complete len:94 (+) Transcript_19309:1124-1405(+)|eukprot:CAMPEP_0116871852 /NCGR_PEP_ID=MMETSP0463-20121206/2373_1 /TAXON_ID=181622 /ORGANISM="Strombidinopsis sp, Strain SopsisLIS2011" /LENGTH=93 /DNA_ID=CAMNT_0004511029 /DNA_START=1024 /DNA_END=1305 /DNA_ORIENTATION=+